jgi:hypothetical protein
MEPRVRKSKGSSAVLLHSSSWLAVKSSVDDSAEREDLEKHTKVHEASLFASYKHRRLQKDHTSSYRDFFPSLTKGRKNSGN